jgi:hypothetical protein
MGHRPQIKLCAACGQIGLADRFAFAARHTSTFAQVAFAEVTDVIDTKQTKSHLVNGWQ